MATIASVLVVTDEAGEATRYPVRKSALLQFERKYHRPFSEISSLDQAIVSFRISHDGRWHASDKELDDWVDTVSIDAEEVPTESNGRDPTDQAPAPSS